MKNLTGWDLAAFIITLVGGINWGLIGLFKLNVIGGIFGQVSLISRLLYLIIGIAAGWLIYTAYVKKE